MSTLPPRMSATRSFRDSVLIDGVGVYRVGVENRLADIAQRLIDRVGEGVHHRGLMVAGNDHAGAAMGL